MADTGRLDRLTEVVERTGAKLVAIGDGAQLPSIGAGGMFDRLADIAPERRALKRAADARPRRAEGVGGPARRALRPGDGALPRQGRLHMADTRDQAVEHAVQNWAA